MYRFFLLLFSALFSGSGLSDSLPVFSCSGLSDSLPFPVFQVRGFYASVCSSFIFVISRATTYTRSLVGVGDWKVNAS